jgi:hypothetical protein
MHASSPAGGAPIEGKKMMLIEADLTRLRYLSVAHPCAEHTLPVVFASTSAQVLIPPFLNQNRLMSEGLVTYLGEIRRSLR